MLCHVLFTRQLRGIVACFLNVRAWCACAHKNGSSAPVSDTVSPRLPVLAQDSHVHTSLGGNKALYAVFDGHGGREVAKFVQNHFTKNLVGCQAYKHKNYKLALENTFLKMDKLLLTEKGKQELR